MRIQIQKKQGCVEKVVCNRCGKQLAVSRTGILQEDCLHVEKTWGYFSGQDGQRIEFDLCEDCTNHMIQEFAVPVYQEDVTELMQ